MNAWKNTWRATVESFLRERRGSDRDARMDAMADALHDARDRLRESEAQLDRAQAQLVREEGAAEDCRRRESMARRIGDDETAAVARSFAEGHERRAAVLRRKMDVLRDEVGLLRADLDEMLSIYRAESRSEAEETGGDAAASGAGRGSPEAGAAGAAPSEGAPSAPHDPLAAEFHDLDARRRARDAEARLEQLKRRRAGEE